MRGTVDMPDGLEDRSAIVERVFEEGSSFAVAWAFEFPQGEFEFAVPTIKGTSARLSFRASGPERGSSMAELTITPPVEDLDVTLPVPVELIEPAPGAVIDADTTFRWTAVPGADVYSPRRLLLLGHLQDGRDAGHAGHAPCHPGSRCSPG